MSCLQARAVLSKALGSFLAAHKGALPTCSKGSGLCWAAPLVDKDSCTEILECLTHSRHYLGSPSSLSSSHLPKQTLGLLDKEPGFNLKLLLLITRL